MIHELAEHDKAVFVTLTYEDKQLPDGATLVVRDPQLFLKRLRKELEGRKIRYYLVGEYGEMTFRPHYHAIMFGLGKEDEGVIRESWGKGFVDVGSVTAQSINYVTAYVQKKLYGPRAKEYGTKVPPFARMSQKLGLGWMTENADHVLQNMGIRWQGKRQRIPRYYALKLKDALTDELWNALFKESFGKRLIDQARKGTSDLDLSQEDRDRRAQVKADAEALKALKGARGRL